MFHIVCQLGFGVSLDSAARGMSLSGKSGGLCGAVVPRFGQKEGDTKFWSTLLRMCGLLWNWRRYAKHVGSFRWITRGGSRREMPFERLALGEFGCKAP